ncbi:hypothetical protein CHS0354_027519, partial [Potamilus streckersoni]
MAKAVEFHRVVDAEVTVLADVIEITSLIIDSPSDLHVGRSVFKIFVMFGGIEVEDWMQ